MSGHLLITGFGSFPGMPRNPAEALARRVGADVRLRLALRTPPRVLVLRTAYAALRSELAPALAERPAAVLMIGVASRAQRLRVEARARNRGSQLHPDASGRPAARLALDRHGPAARSSPHAARALAALRRHGLAVRPSIDAGHYLCNASYFLALAEAGPVLFVHVPPAARTRRPRGGGRPPSRVEPARQAAALVEVALAMVVRARDAEIRGAAVRKPPLARSMHGGRHVSAESGPSRRVEESAMVDTDRVVGGAKEALGKAQGAAGDVVGSNHDSVEGRFREAQGGAQNAYGQAKDKARDVADKAGDAAGDAYGQAKDRARDAADRAGDAASDAYGQAKSKARDVADRAGDAASDAYGQAKSKARDVADKAGDYANDAYGQARGRARDLADRAGDVASDAYDRAGDYAGDAYQRGGTYLRDGRAAVGARVEESPMVALLIAGAVGYALALLVHGRR